MHWHRHPYLPWWAGARAREAQEAAAEAREAATAPAGAPAEAPVPFEALVEGGGAGEGGAPDLTAALRRIREVARVLGNFAALRDPARPRADYMEQVRRVPVPGCWVARALSGIECVAALQGSVGCMPAQQGFQDLHVKDLVGPGWRREAFCYALVPGVARPACAGQSVCSTNATWARIWATNLLIQGYWLLLSDTGGATCEDL